MEREKGRSDSSLTSGPAPNRRRDADDGAMANSGQTSGGTAPGTTEAVRHHSPEFMFRQQPTAIATATAQTTTILSSQPTDTRDPASALAPAHFARRSRPPEPSWLLSPYADVSDFPDFALLSSPVAGPRALAPPHQPVDHLLPRLSTLPLPLLLPLPLPLPLPRPSLDHSHSLSHPFLHADRYILVSTPPQTALTGLLARPCSRLPSPSFADRPTGPGLPPLMPPRQSLDQQTRPGRLSLGFVDSSPSPRPRPSRRARNSSPESPTTRHPSDRPGSRSGRVKTERRGSRTPAPADASAVAMPPVTRKRAAAGAASSSGSSSSASSLSRPAGAEALPPPRAPKRQRASPQQPTNRLPHNTVALDSDAFSDPFDDAANFDELERQAKGASGNSARLKTEEEAADVIDLVDDEVPPPPPKPKSENQIKLGSLQCSICMDDMTNLTVTHCGHLFCGECLHGALHASLNKSVCPICRQKIDVRASGVQNTKSTRGFFHLQLKVMTATRKGKMKEGGAAR